MTGIINLTKSKRGVFCVFVVALAFVLVLLDKLTGQGWVDFAKWIAITLVTAHTVSGVTSASKSGAGATTPAQLPPSAIS